MKPEIINIDERNISLYPPTCFLNKKNEGYLIKEQWIKKRFEEGLKIKAFYDNDDGKIHGFVELVPGEFAWRAVDATGYLFIHCIWINPNSYKSMGNGSLLIKECIKEARGTSGIAVITSNDAFMAKKEIFLKNGFTQVSEDGKYQLLVLQLKPGKMPELRDYKKQLAKYKGLYIVYSNQCPWVSRFIEELDEKLVDTYHITIKELKTAKEAQEAPSIYSVFNIIYNGKLIVSHYISTTRFLNILKKEVKY